MLERGLLDQERLEQILSVEAMTRGGIAGASGAGEASKAGKAGGTDKVAERENS